MKYYKVKRRSLSLFRRKQKSNSSNNNQLRTGTRAARIAQKNYREVKNHRGGNRLSRMSLTPKGRIMMRIMTTFSEDSEDSDKLTNI